MQSAFTTCTPQLNNSAPECDNSELYQPVVGQCMMFGWLEDMIIYS